MRSSAWPIKLIPIEHKVISVTVDKEAMNSKMKTHNFKPAAQKIYKITTISRWAPRLVSSIQCSTKCEISKLHLLFLSYG